MKNSEQVKIEPGENKKDEEALQELLVTHTQFSLLLIKDVKALKWTEPFGLDAPTPYFLNRTIVIF